MTTRDNTKIAAEVIEAPAQNWLTDTYLPFALYAIKSRALVGDDGLKPVARRVLYSMFQKGITHNNKHLKAARAAADAVAYHPHGSSSIEEALARLAQDFTLRVPLIDPYGSVGFVTGDTPAAARYWEARLTRAAYELVREIPDGAVELGKNFDGELDEPHTLPIRWPVSVINGTQGISVGYASNMYSHNPDEVMDAARALLKNPNLSLDRLLKLMPGPDLPTGGELHGIDGVKEYYEAGSGSFIVRGRYTTENMTRGKMKIVFYELPYQVSAEQVMSRIRALQAVGKLKELASVKDLTDKRNGLRLVLETKSGSNHVAILNALFKETPLEQKFSVNSTVLIDGKPLKTSMLDLLRGFLELRRAATIRKAQTRFDKIQHRMKQLDAILAILVDIDKAIAIIRGADTIELAQSGLMKRFKLDETQADYILAMQLRRLTKQDSLSVKNEKKNLSDEAAELKLVLSDPAKRDEIVDKDLLEVKKIISSKRRTIISGMTTEEVKEEAKAFAQQARDVEKNVPAYLTRFADGRFIKTSEPFAYAKGLKKLKYGPIIEQFKVKTQDKVVAIGSDGVGRKIPVSYIAADYISKASDAGVQLPKGVKLVGLVKELAAKSDVGVALGTKDGLVKLSKTDFGNKDEFPVILLDQGDEVVETRWIGRTLTGSHFYFISASGNVLFFDATTVRLAGSKAGGVKGFKLRDAADEAVAFGWIPNLKAEELVVLSKGRKTLKLTLAGEIPVKGKGGQGVALHQFKPGEEALTNAFVGTHTIGSITQLGNVVNSPTASKRAARGLDFDPTIEFGSTEVFTL